VTNADGAAVPGVLMLRTMALDEGQAQSGAQEIIGIMMAYSRRQGRIVVADLVAEESTRPTPIPTDAGVGQ